VSNLNGVPLRIRHAWVEIGRRYVFDTTMQDVFTIAEYYRTYQAEAEVKYTARGMRKPMCKAGHYGPWHVETWD